jgi:hypothetical protein
MRWVLPATVMDDPVTDTARHALELAEELERAADELDRRDSENWLAFDEAMAALWALVTRRRAARPGTVRRDLW